MDPRGEDGPLQKSGGTGVDSDSRDGSGECCVASPCRWLRRLSRELHWSFVLAVFAIYVACQGVANAVGVVAATYYKDMLRIQPATAQFYQGIIDAPWVVKPLWGLLTDVVGYRRRPYFLLASEKIGLLRYHFICQYVLLRFLLLFHSPLVYYSHLILGAPRQPPVWM